MFLVGARFADRRGREFCLRIARGIERAGHRAHLEVGAGAGGAHQYHPDAARGTTRAEDKDFVHRGTGGTGHSVDPRRDVGEHVVFVEIVEIEP